MVNLVSRANTVYLCRSVLEKDNNNQLTFASKADQQNYFLNPPVLLRILPNVTYTREPVNGEVKSYISVEIPIEELYTCNYVVYKNNNTDRYFFAFIDRLEYVSHKVTNIHLSSDSFQNWQFDIEYLQSFIDRQTPVEDEYNTLADEVAHGQLVETSVKNVTFRGGYFVFCSSDVTQDVVTESTPYALQIGQYNIPCWVLYYAEADSDKMGNDLVYISDHGWADRIISVVYVPFVNSDIVVTHQTVGQGFNVPVATSINPDFMKSTVSLDITINTSKYLKSYTYPYAKIVVQDLITGTTIELAPEKFLNNIAEFEIRQSISETPYYKVIPKNYEGQSLAFNHALVVRCETTLPHINNLYAKYLMTNKQSNDLSRFNAIMGTSVNLATAPLSPSGVMNNGLSLYSQLSSVTIRENQASMLGNSVTSLKDGAEERILNNHGIKISLFTMDNNHDKMSNNFWKMFGYPVRSLGVPNITGNPKYNYVKLGVPNLLGRNIPQDELLSIKNMFYSGVTLWHDPTTFLRY